MDLKHYAAVALVVGLLMVIVGSYGDDNDSFMSGRFLLALPGFALLFGGIAVIVIEVSIRLWALL